MNFTVYLALFGWIPVTLFLFSVLPGQRAVLVSIIGGYLFLPMAAIRFPGVPDITKTTMIGAALLLGVLLLDSRRIGSLRFRWFDLPILIWCFAPLASSMRNGLGVYDGLSGMVESVTAYGIPYFVGRMYFRTTADLKALAVAVFIGGLIYVPLCLYEIRMSPTLHHHLYGYNQHVFAQTRRMGGWRPMVFLQHGLALGLWMCGTGLVGFWLWRLRQLSKVWNLAPAVSVPLVCITAVLCKSLGSLMLGALAAVVLIASGLRRTTFPLLLLVLIVPAYLTLRLAFDWRAETVVSLVSSIDASRGDSLAGRIEADRRLRERAMQRPLFGWGGWNRFRKGTGPTLPDSFWAIILGQKGFVGMLSLFGCLVLSQYLALRRMRRMRLSVADRPEIAALIAFLAMFTLDCMVNTMPSPVFILIAGALAAWSADRTPVPPSALVTRRAAAAPSRTPSLTRTAAPQRWPEVR